MTKKDNETKEVKKTTGKIITYIGQGDVPPIKINFMGKQEFVRGKAVEVIDNALLAKLENNPCFVEGEVEMEQLAEADEKARAEAEEQKKKDTALNKAAKKRFSS